MHHSYHYHVHLLGEPKSEHVTPWRIDFFPIRDHPINQKDLMEMIALQSPEFHSWSIPFHTLLEETGDFTYNVIYQIKEFGQWITDSRFYTQDHKYTPSTANSDTREFIRALYPSVTAIAPKEWSSDYTKILFFSEISNE